MMAAATAAAATAAAATDNHTLSGRLQIDMRCVTVHNGGSTPMAERECGAAGYALNVSMYVFCTYVFDTDLY